MNYYLDLPADNTRLTNGQNFSQRRLAARGMGLNNMACLFQ